MSRKIKTRRVVLDPQVKEVEYEATVEENQFIYQGSPISPASLANSITGTRRNAWRDLWIKRPNVTEWRLADDCRSDGRAGS
ncbi:hypothetical protein [Paludibacterium denitrificans]|uniref:Uncharacterized protein n=1 Tax=Paludibacterium denitrificans TaxID=2675226 RepID=A0A844GFZ1_9NEIS|nr:hypothetical protein [Paludibacterium denitrificans]MTD33604.1 hypothetical protein [Paludibacterium denitrificans]